MKRKCMFVSWAFLGLSVSYLLLVNCMGKNIVFSFISIIHETYIASGASEVLLLWIYPIQFFASFFLVPLFFRNKKLSIFAAAAHLLDVFCMFYCFADNIFEKLIKNTATELMAFGDNGCKKLVVNKYEGVAWQLVLSLDVALFILFVYRVVKCPAQLPDYKKDDHVLWSYSEIETNRFIKSKEKDQTS